MLDVIMEIYRTIEKSGDRPNNLLPTELYNEGWMLRLVLNWFYQNKGNGNGYKICMNEGAHWFSEGRLPTPFLSNSRNFYTPADGIYGDIEIGGKGASDVVLKKPCNQFVVIEAKMFSNYAQHTTHAKGYNQAARLLASMCRLITESSTIDSISDIRFYTFLPESQKTTEKTFAEFTNREHVKKVIEDRIKESKDPDTDLNYDPNVDTEEWFGKFVRFLGRVDIQLITWEDIIAHIKSKDKKYGDDLERYYTDCLRYNQKKKSDIDKKQREDAALPQKGGTVEPVDEDEEDSDLDYIPRGQYRGVSMIYAPEIDPKTFLHFSWNGHSCALRDYSEGGKPIIDKTKKTEDVLPLIELEAPNIDHKRWEEFEYWATVTQDLNAKKGL